MVGLECLFLRQGLTGLTWPDYSSLYIDHAGFKLTGIHLPLPLPQYWIKGVHYYMWLWAGGFVEKILGL